MAAMRDAPFNEGQIVRHRESGRTYKVLRGYVPPKPDYFDLGSFELVEINPPVPEPFLQARPLADNYEMVE